MQPRSAAWMRCRTAASWTALTSLSAGAIAQPAAIEVRLDRGYSPAVVDAVARVGEPSLLTIPKGSDFQKIVTARCGQLDPVYILAFLRENPALNLAALEQLPSGSEHLFPACARAPAVGRHVIEEGQTIESLFRRRGMPIDARAVEQAGDTKSTRPAISCLAPESGATAARAGTCTERGFVAAQNAARFVRLNPDIDVQRLVPGETTVLIPQDPLWTAIPLRDGVSPEAALALVESAGRVTVPGRPDQAVSGRASVSVSRASVASLIDDVPVPEGLCRATDHWPFSLEQLEQALAANVGARRPGHHIRQARVLVLDTGLDARFRGRAIPDFYFGKAMAVGFPSSIIYPGVNLVAATTDATPPDNLDDRLHGSEVASALLGGERLEQRHATHRLPVELIFGSLAAWAGDASYLSTNGINEALAYASDNNIPIINGSVSASEGRGEFAVRLERTRNQILFVTAAGNNGERFEGDNLTWPGALGGDPRNAGGGLIVTVGAHDTDGNIFSFSRRGAEQVDLLAPGCSVPSFSETDGEIRPVSRAGTSFAAPLVTLTAALLYAEGLPPQHIKTRLLMSVDVDAALHNEVYSRGRLNVARALSVWRDVVDYYHGPVRPDGTRERRRVTGRVVYPNDAITLCSLASVKVGSLWKLSVAENSANAEAPRRLYAWTRRVGGALHEFDRSESCNAAELQGRPLIIQDSETNQQTIIPLADLIDFTAHALRI